MRISTASIKLLLICLQLPYYQRSSTIIMFPFHITLRRNQMLDGIFLPLWLSPPPPPPPWPIPTRKALWYAPPHQTSLPLRLARPNGVLFPGPTGYCIIPWPNGALYYSLAKRGIILFPGQTGHCIIPWPNRALYYSLAQRGIVLFPVPTGHCIIPWPKGALYYSLSQRGIVLFPGPTGHCIIPWPNVA